jgi:hypothetical protein
MTEPSDPERDSKSMSQTANRSARRRTKETCTQLGSRTTAEVRLLLVKEVPGQKAHDKGTGATQHHEALNAWREGQEQKNSIGAKEA